MIDLLSEAVGGRVVDFNDEFFAEAANLIKDSDPIWRDGVYNDRGKWMDGWETRRRREPGYDWCVLALGVSGLVERVTIDTAFFTGNYPEQFSLEACGVGSDDRLGDAEWTELIPATDLEGDAKASFDVDGSPRVTHLRLNIYPDGGVARLRVEGSAVPAMQDVCPGELVDLASQTLGGEFIDASDLHYNPPSKMLRPTAPAGMFDGWETKRRRGPGHDWASFRLGLAGTVEQVDADTSFFKGNAPGWVSVDLSDDGAEWETVVDHVAIAANSVNSIRLDDPAHAGYARLSIHPDGGMARFRVWGWPDPVAAGEKRLQYLNALDPQMVESFFHTACGSGNWVSSMAVKRPFATIDEVLNAADQAFEELGEDDWLEAFASHPRIGERAGPLATSEQSGVEDSSLEELAAVNREYEEKFGFTYIVYATGKTGAEMLGMAKERLGSTRDEEIRNAAAEQRKITATRLRRMLCQEVP